MVANRHTCCICHEPRHPVEKHHIDEDPSNNVWENLAVLCRNCHGLVTAKSSLGSRYAKGEVLAYKRAWEKRCAEVGAEEIESPVEEIHETKLIEGSENEEYPFDMDEGDELVFSLDANDFLDVVICDEDDIDEWSEAEHDEESPLPDCYWSRTGVMEGEYAFVAPEEGRYVLLLVNWDDEATEVTVDAAVWEAEEK
ncbi:MAG: HNH endonuclease [Bryobacteraceae bacterium]|nr:HNH endonuclease [Bryobacteraceae bacterium]